MISSKAEILEVMRSLRAASCALRRVVYLEKELNDEELANDLDALEQHLDNASGRAAHVFADLVRINRGA